MAEMNAEQLPCQDGHCMKCKEKVHYSKTVPCKICSTRWHVSCLNDQGIPQGAAGAAWSSWECPDCSNPDADGGNKGAGSGLLPPPAQTLAAVIRAIEEDDSLTPQEKNNRRQQLLTGNVATTAEAEDEEGE